MADILRREQLLKREPVTFLDLPEMDGGVWLRRLSGYELSRIQVLFEQSNAYKDMPLQELEHNTDCGAWLIIYTVCDAQGAQIFQESDINAIRDLPGPLFNKLFREALKVSYLTDSSLDELKKSMNTEVLSSSGTV